MTYRNQSLGIGLARQLVTRLFRGVGVGEDSLKIGVHVLGG